MAPISSSDSKASSVNKVDDCDSSGWSASLYNKTASFVYSPLYTAPVLELLDARPGERILDIGCGSGEVTLVIQDIVEKERGGIVVGVDQSESMIAKAASNGVKNRFISDVQSLEIPSGQFGFPEEKFDAVFSNATLHWCKRDPLGVLNGVRKVLKPKGRFAMEMGGFMNCVGLISTIYTVLKDRGYNPEEKNPWFFPSVEDYTKLLTAAGLEPTHISLNPRLTSLQGDDGLYDFLKLFARQSFFSGISENEADEIMREVVRRCSVDCRDSSGHWALMYVRLRVRAVLKA